jgi:hypothetical protein
MAKMEKKISVWVESRPNLGSGDLIEVLFSNPTRWVLHEFLDWCDHSEVCRECGQVMVRARFSARSVASDCERSEAGHIIVVKYGEGEDGINWRRRSPF